MPESLHLPTSTQPTQRATASDSLLPALATLAAVLVLTLWTVESPPASGEEPPHGAQQLAQRLADRLSGAAPAPADAQAWALLGRTRVVTGDWAGALTAFERATQQSPQEANLWAERARAAIVLARGEPSAALGWVQQALRLDPQEPLALTLAGDLAYNAGQLTQAQQHWQAAQRSAESQTEVDSPLLAGVQERLASIDAALSVTRSTPAK
jgi:cytochrome c-type biogenesis protein CcmH